MPRKCKLCGKKTKRNGNIFCSRPCYDSYRSSIGSKRISRECSTCGKHFFVQPNQIKKNGGKYCSYFCLNHRDGRGKKYRRVCVRCGESYDAPVDRRFKYCSAKCMNKRVGELAPGWKGGRSVNERGYVIVLVHNHPRAHNNKIYEHTIVAEKILGRYMLPDEVVHHRNGNKGDNRTSNIQIMTRSEHMKLHGGGEWKPE